MSNNGPDLIAGGYEIRFRTANLFRLDGGAMFGSVPKTLWSRRIEADELNRIPLCCRILELRSKNHTALVDIGCGTKWREKEREIYQITQESAVFADAEGPTDIVLTHLHFDHAGGVTTLDSSGAPTLAFPKARVWVGKDNWDVARDPGPRERASYLAEHVLPLAHADLRLTQDGDEVLPAVRVFHCHGHTRGMQWVLIGQGESAVAYVADLIPTAHHLPVPYVMGYDMCAETSMKEKAQFLDRAEREGWWVAFEHDHQTAAAKVGRDTKGNFVVIERFPRGGAT